jgi:hypothetical protein
MALVNIDRRTTLAWLATAMAVGELDACAKVGDSDWPTLEPIKAKGYGTDPDLLDPKTPWPLTLKKGELAILAAATDLIMPAAGGAPSASQVGVPAFIDEWVSAPYASQQRDRGLIVPGLAWLDKQVRMKGGPGFAAARAEDQKAVFDRIAWKGKVAKEDEKAADFFRRLRSLTVGAYFTTEAGWKNLGYPGATPIQGLYPGPTPEAVAHMKDLVQKMGLTFTAP